MATMIDSRRMNQVRLAAQQLRAALDAPPIHRAMQIREAKEFLLSAAEQQETDATGAREYFLAAASLEKTPEAAPADIMTIVISDLSVANTLMAAGAALEETETKADPAKLDQAVIGLQQSSDVNENAIRAFAFSSEPVHSADLPSARDSFRERTEEALKELISKAKDACSGAITAMKKLDPQKLIQALADLGGPLAQLPRVGSLFQKGLEKMQSALDFLRRLLDADFMSEIKEKLSSLWERVKDGSWADDLLGWTFNRPAIEAMLPKAASSPQLTPDQVDRATGDLAPLVEKFSSEMKWAKALTAAVGFGGSLLVYASAVTAGTSALFVGGAYLMILAAIIVIGRDSAGTGKLLHNGRGVESIIEGLITT